MNTATWKVQCPDAQTEREWSSWFATPGDADDFIFYWDDNAPQSEK